MKLSELRELIREEVEKVLDEEFAVEDYQGFRREVGRTLGRKLVNGEFNEELFGLWRECTIESIGTGLNSERLELFVNEAVRLINEDCSVYNNKE